MAQRDRGVFERWVRAVTLRRVRFAMIAFTFVAPACSGSHGAARCSSTAECGSNELCYGGICRVAVLGQSEDASTDSGELDANWDGEADAADAEVDPGDAEVPADAADAEVDPGDAEVPLDADDSGDDAGTDPCADGGCGDLTVTLQTGGTSVGVASTGSFTISMTPVPSMDTQVNYTVSGTAGTVHDHGLSGGLVTFLAHAPSAEKTVTFPVLANAAYNGGTPKTIIVTLDNDANRARGLRMGDYPTETIQINNPAARPTVRFASATQNVSEGASVSVTVELDHPSSEATMVYLTSVPGSGAPTYYTLSTSFSFPAYQTSKSVTFSSSDNTTYDGSRNVVLGFSTGTGFSLGFPSTDTLTVLDNEAAPVFSFDRVAPYSNPSFALGATNTVWVNPDPRVEVTPRCSMQVIVPYVRTGSAVFGDDMNLPPAGNFVISAGSSYGTLEIETYAGSAVDSKTVFMTLQSPPVGVIGANGTYSFAIETHL